jgi:hypothetical protein
MAIPDNFLFSLQDVADDMGLDDNIPPINSLAEAFQYANEYGFDELYQNASNDTLREFRNYDHTAQVITYTIGISGRTIGDPVSYLGESGTLTFAVSPDPNTVVGTFASLDSWISLSNNTNKTDGQTVNVTVDPQPSTTSAPRSGTVRITSSSLGVLNSPANIIIDQEAGPDYGGPIP